MLPKRGTSEALDYKTETREDTKHNLEEKRHRMAGIINAAKLKVHEVNHIDNIL